MQGDHVRPTPVRLCEPHKFASANLWGTDRCTAGGRTRRRIHTKETGPPYTS